MNRRAKTLSLVPPALPSEEAGDSADSPHGDSRGGARIRPGAPSVGPWATATQDAARLATARIVVAAQAGSEAAMEELIRLYQGRIARFVMSIVGADDQVWEDLCQNIFVTMVLSVGRLRTPEVFESWLFRIAHNACISHLRRRRWRNLFVSWQPYHDHVASETPGPPDDRLKRFERALEELPPDQRKLIALLRDHAWSYEEMAKITNCSVAALKSRLFRARERLKTILREGESDDE